MVSENFFGTDADSVAEGETYDFVNDKIKGWDTGDRVRRLFGGASEEEVLKQKRQQVLSTLNTSTQSLRQKLKQRAGQLGYEVDPTDLEYQIGSGKTKETYKGELDDLKSRIAQLETLKAIPGASLEGLSLESSPAQVQSAIEAAQQQRKVDIEKEDPGSSRNLAIQQQENLKYDREYRRWKAGEDDKWRRWQVEKQDARDRADRQERSLQREQNKELSMMDYNARREDRRYAREDRLHAQRQQSIMALMKGLTQMGAGFAI